MKKEPLFIAVGNLLKGDDGIGPIIAQRLKDKINIFDAGQNPENYLAKISQETVSRVWIVDCLDFGQPAGSWKIFSPDQLEREPMYFTHNFSLKTFCDYLKVHASVRVSIFGIQPRQMKFAQGLSKEIESVLPTIERKLIALAKLRRR